MLFRRLPHQTSLLNIQLCDVFCNGRDFGLWRGFLNIQLRDVFCNRLDFCVSNGLRRLRIAAGVSGAFVLRLLLLLLRGWRWWIRFLLYFLPFCRGQEAFLDWRKELVDGCANGSLEELRGELSKAEKMGR